MHMQRRLPRLRILFACTRWLLRLLMPARRARNIRCGAEFADAPSLRTLRLIERATRSVAVDQEVDVIKVSENELALLERP